MCFLLLCLIVWDGSGYSQCVLNIGGVKYHWKSDSQVCPCANCLVCQLLQVLQLHCFLCISCYCLRLSIFLTCIISSSFPLLLFQIAEKHFYFVQFVPLLRCLLCIKLHCCFLHINTHSKYFSKKIRDEFHISLFSNILHSTSWSSLNLIFLTLLIFYISK